VAGVTIEDKLFPKTNSFLRSEQQPLADIEEFCGKIKAGKDSQVDADFVVAGVGVRPAIALAEKAGLRIDSGIVVDASLETSAPGIFAIGDVATYRGKLKLILTGFAEAASAAHAIYPLLNNGKPLHFEYSTSKGAPGSAGKA